MSRLPDLDEVISSEEVHLTAESIASLQLPSGMIPWFVGGHCDPWNHVETAMALDARGLHERAELRRQRREAAERRESQRYAHSPRIRQQPEQEAVINADSLPRDGGARFEPHRADKSRRFSPRQPAKHGQRPTRYVPWHG